MSDDDDDICPMCGCPLECAEGHAERVQDERDLWNRIAANLALMATRQLHPDMSDDEAERAAATFLAGIVEYETTAATAIAYPTARPAEPVHVVRTKGELVSTEYEDGLWERFAEIVERVLPDGPYVAKEQAQKIHAYLGEQDPELLDELERLWALAAINETLLEHQRRKREAARRVIRHARSEAHLRETVANGGLHLYEQRFHVGNKIHKQMGDLTSADCRYLATDSAKRSRHWRLRESLWTQLAKRIPATKVLRDVMTEADCAALERAITNQSE